MIRILLILTLVLLTSCAAKQANQMDQFVNSSKEYLDTSDILLKQAKDSAFSSSHAVVSLNRYNGVARSSNGLIRKQNDEVSSYYELIRQLRKQRSLLYSYFVSLTELTQGKKSSSSVGSKFSWLLPRTGNEQATEEVVAESAYLPQEIADALVLVNRQIETLEVNGQRIESLMEQRPAVLIARLNNFALEEELRQRETMIRYSLSLHRAAMQAISMKMDHELDNLANQKMLLRKKIERQVENPYNDFDRRLDHCWTANRQMLLEEFAGMEASRRDASKAASLAEEGAHYMQRAFYAVLEGERDIYQLPLLDVKTKELSAVLQASQQSELSALPEECRGVVLSTIEEVQAVPSMTAPVRAMNVPMQKPRKSEVVVHTQPKVFQAPRQQRRMRPSMNTWATANSYGPVQKGDTLYSVAKNMRADDRYSVAQVMAALFKKNKTSFNFKKLGLLKLEENLVAPTSKEIEKLTPKQAGVFVKKHQ